MDERRALLSREKWGSSMCFHPCLGAQKLSTMFSFSHVTDTGMGQVLKQENSRARLPDLKPGLHSFLVTSANSVTALDPTVLISIMGYMEVPPIEGKRGTL